MLEPIPFHVTLESSAYSLAAFMPYGPTPSLLSPTKQHTRIQLLRQSVVDVRYALRARRWCVRALSHLTHDCRNTVVFGTKTDIWRVRCIGTGSFRRAVRDL